MEYLRKIGVCISLLIVIIFVTSCGGSNKIAGDSEETQIKKSFMKTLDIYPIKNLEDLYDKEDYRDGEFEKGDKEMWTVYADFAKGNKSDKLDDEGTVLNLDRNTRTVKGYYFVKKFYEEDKFSGRKSYRVEMKNNKIILLDKVDDPDLKKRIENSGFFEQYANFKDLENYNNGDVSIDWSVPSYGMEYKMSSKDENIKQLKNRYNIPTDKVPMLKMHIDGDLKGNSVRYKRLEVDFSEEDRDVSAIDYLSYKPAKK